MRAPGLPSVAGRRLRDADPAGRHQQAIRGHRAAAVQAIVSQALGVPAAVWGDLGIASVRTNSVAGQMLQILVEPTSFQTASDSAATARAQLGCGLSLVRG
ncbi:hypothetical protein [Azospirillum brasilense]|uniref:hypothetical protein n=1 Tax=Azospirillum brasilense TaxID=192 RepID=UPI0011EF3A32|nr:hypothetical protein [Azospirillum brasilense]